MATSQVWFDRRIGVRRFDGKPTGEGLGKMLTWLSNNLGDPRYFPVIEVGAISVIAFIFLVTMVVEIRRTRRALCSRLDSVSVRLMDLSHLVATDGPFRHALAGVIAVRRGQRASTEELREAVREVLAEWKQADALVAELKDTLMH